ncbi:MAG TPA: hypothetical protein VNA22_09645 [Pyrinomonadaceae bacterium]|nr:hypothetical protein [Pyrinomonadaceae bacterium]
MNYPIDLSFKRLALASQIYIRDGSGSQIGYVKQKLLKLKEDINVFADDAQTRLLFNIKADRVLDFSAKYNFTDAGGSFIGSIKRKGMRSIFKASYEIYDARDMLVMTIHEENGWIKVIDSLVGEIPIVGMFTGYLFHPSYLVARTDNSPVARLVKQPAFFEGKFQMTQIGEMRPDEEARVLLSLLTMTLLERGRG